MNVGIILSFIGSVLTFLSVIIAAWLNLRKTGEVHSLVTEQHEDLVSALNGTLNPHEEEGQNDTHDGR
jgi:uncharacterized membrane protein